MSDLDELRWRFVPESSAWGPIQMALEEVAAETIRDGGPALVRVFRWKPSTLSLGYHQSPGTVDWTYCSRRGIDVTRRQTGGGGIYHDHYGDISYSIVVPASAVPSALLDSYHLLCEPLLTFLRGIGLDADFAEREHPALHQPACFLRSIHPAHDILVDGRKVSGNAQYRQRDVVIQHGSINVTNDPSVHLGAFVDHGVDADAFGDRVTAIDKHVDLDRSRLVTRLEEALRSWSGADRATWTATEREAASDLARKKYADESWIHRSTASATE